MNLINKNSMDKFRIQVIEIKKSVIFLVDKIIDNETQDKKYPIIIDNGKFNNNHA